MKKSIILFLLSLTLFSFRKEESSLSIPNGVSEKGVSAYLAKIYPKSNYSIETIEYSEKGNVIVSYVTYKAEGKVYKNLAFVNGLGNIKLNNTTYAVSTNTGYVVKCVGDCSGGNTKCSMRGSYDPSTGVNTIECSCEGCVMQVNQQ